MINVVQTHIFVRKKHMVQKKSLPRRWLHAVADLGGGARGARPPY